jgi:hypothetical protein
MVRLEVIDDFDVSKEQELSLLSLFRVLGNETFTLQLFELMHSHLPFGRRSLDDFVESDGLMNREMLMKSCASQFSSYSTNEVSRLGKNTLHALLSSRNLGIMSEDVYLEMLIELGSNSYEYWQYLKICFLSSSGISRFVETLPFEGITSDLWRQICH